MKIIIVIPARLKSSRFPEKPIKKILGIPMIIRVAKICEKIIKRENIIIATDSKKILNNYIFKNYFSVKSISCAIKIIEPINIIVNMLFLFVRTNFTGSSFILPDSAKLLMFLVQ